MEAKVQDKEIVDFVEKVKSTNAYKILESVFDKVDCNYSEAYKDRTYPVGDYASLDIYFANENVPNGGVGSYCIWDKREMDSNEESITSRICDAIKSTLDCLSYQLKGKE